MCSHQAVQEEVSVAFEQVKPVYVQPLGLKLRVFTVTSYLAAGSLPAAVNTSSWSDELLRYKAYAEQNLC